MKNRKLILKLILLFFVLQLVGCKEQEKKKKQAITVDDVTDSYNNDLKKYSFTISCGSGCALVYNARKVTKNKVSYQVDQYVNEILSVKKREDELTSFSFKCESENFSRSIYNEEGNDILKSDDYHFSLKNALNKVGDLFCNRIYNEGKDTSKLTILQLPFEMNKFIKETEKNDIEKYKILEGESLKSLKRELFKDFYDDENEAIIKIYKFNTRSQKYKNYIVVSENPVGYDYSIVSFKNNVLISGLLLSSQETDEMSNNALINDKLVIKLITPDDKCFAEYKLTNKGIIEQVFDNREHMKNYQSILQTN